MKILKYLLYLSPIIIFMIYDTAIHLEGGELGSKSNPIKFYFTPSVDADRITTNARGLIDYLEKETGYHFVSGVPASYVAVIEAFGSKKADMAAGLSAFSYLMAHQKYGATAYLRLVRTGDETTYKGQFIARVGSGINSIEDLQGKSIAFVDPSSTSGYILPNALLKRKGIKPSEEVFAMRHENVVTMVYQKQVDAGATYYAPPNPKTGGIMDARMRVLPQFPDVADKIKIIGFTESIPNDPIIFSKDMPASMRDKIIKAILDFMNTKEGQHALFEIYDATGLIPTSDSDFDGLRQILKEQNINLEKMLK